LSKRQLTNRKLTLFDLACIERLLQHTSDNQYIQHLPILERLADGERVSHETGTLRKLIEAEWPDPLAQDISCLVAYSIYFATFDIEAAMEFQSIHGWTGDSNYKELLSFFKDCSAGNAAEAISHLRFKLRSKQHTAYTEERQLQATYLRDLFANPYQVTHLDRDWLQWNGGSVVQLTRSIFGERKLDCLPILADALEDAGCDNAEILSHCRSPGPHVRGCWAVDLILGKK
jgi:hypothetical protein